MFFQSLLVMWNAEHLCPLSSAQQLRQYRNRTYLALFMWRIEIVYEFCVRSYIVSTISLHFSTRLALYIQFSYITCSPSIHHHHIPCPLKLMIRRMANFAHSHHIASCEMANMLHTNVCVCARLSVCSYLFFALFRFVWFIRSTCDVFSYGRTNGHTDGWMALNSLLGYRRKYSNVVLHRMRISHIHNNTQ